MDYSKALCICILVGIMVLGILGIISWYKKSYKYFTVGIVLFISIILSFFLCDIVNGVNSDIVAEIYPIDKIENNKIYYNNILLDMGEGSGVISCGKYNDSTDVIVDVTYTRDFAWLFSIKRKEIKGRMIYLSQENYNQVVNRMYK